MKLSSKNLKAINWYSENYHLKPQLSTPPIMYFMDSSGEYVDHHLDKIMLEYAAWNKEDQRRRAYEKKTADARSISRR